MLVVTFTVAMPTSLRVLTLCLNDSLPRCIGYVRHHIITRGRENVPLMVIVIIFCHTLVGILLYVHDLQLAPGSS